MVNPLNPDNITPLNLTGLGGQLTVGVGVAVCGVGVGVGVIGRVGVGTGVFGGTPGCTHIRTLN